MAAPAIAQDTPGQAFRLSPADLPPPYRTLPVMNPHIVTQRPAGALPQVPKGFEVNLFAELGSARWMVVAPNGDVFASQPRTGSIIVLRDNGTGTAGPPTTFISGLVRFSGLAMTADHIYYSDLNGVYRIPYNAGDTVARAKPEKLPMSKALPNDGMHGGRGLAVAKDGTVYLTVGSRDNVSEFRPGAEVIKIDTRGTATTYASGLRNPVGITLRPDTGAPYVTVNERDGLGDKLAPDYFTAVQPNGFYGYPYSYAGRIPDPNWASKDPGGKIASAITPDVFFPAHSAPIGLAFYTGGSFPKDYQGDAFVALHGSWNTSEPTGYKVVRVHFVNGKPEGGYENFLTGFTLEAGPRGQPARTWGRPAGLAVAKDGSLLLSDDQSGRIWRVQYKGD